VRLGTDGGAVSNDRLSQPSDNAAATFDISVSGVPGRGVIVFGYGPPATSVVSIESPTGVLAHLPTHQRELEAFFAVPIPDNVHVATLRFMDAEGNVLNVVNLPPFPKNMGGTYGGVFDG